jgi:hypothetical protein
VKGIVVRQEKDSKGLIWEMSDGEQKELHSGASSEGFIKQEHRLN